MTPIEITKDQIAALLISHVVMAKRINQIDNLLKGIAFIEYFSEALEVAEEVILDLCGVPSEGSDFSELGMTTDNMHPMQVEQGFCRDWYYDLLSKLEDVPDEEIDTACDITVINLLEEWSQDEHYITKRSLE